MTHVTKSYASGLNCALTIIGKALHDAPGIDHAAIAQAIRLVITATATNKEELRQEFLAPLDSLLAGVTNTGMNPAPVVSIHPRPDQ